MLFPISSPSSGKASGYRIIGSNGLFRLYDFLKTNSLIVKCFIFLYLTVHKTIKNGKILSVRLFFSRVDNHDFL